MIGLLAAEAAEWNLPGGDWPMAVQMGIVFPLVWIVGNWLGRSHR